MANATAPLDTVKLLADRRVALMLGLGFSSGLPFLLVFGTLSAWLRESQVSLSAIGLFSYLAFAYSLKFLWSPIVDAFDPPILSRFLGRRRAWMLSCQVLIALGLIGVSMSDPASRIWVTAAFALLVAFGSATQDVVIDGWRIDAAPSSRQGMMAAAYQLGYRFAIMASGAGALYIADLVSWSAAYLTMAALVGIGMISALLAPIVDRHADAPALEAGGTHGGSAPAPAAFSFARAIVDPLADLFQRNGVTLLAILVLVSLYRLPDFVAGVMANPLYIDLGFSKSEIATVSKLYGVWIGILGAFAGGLLLPRLGLRTTLLIGAIAGAGSNLMFSWLALADTPNAAVTMLGRTFDLSFLAMPGRKLELLTLAISIDNFSGSFAGTALIAYMSGLTGPGFAATQYALLSSLYALPGKFIGGLAGFMVEGVGYPVFFAMTALVGIPVVVLCLAIRRLTPEEAAPEAVGHDADAQVPVAGGTPAGTPAPAR